MAKSATRVLIDGAPSVANCGGSDRSAVVSASHVTARAVRASEHGKCDRFSHEETRDVNRRGSQCCAGRDFQSAIEPARQRHAEDVRPAHHNDENARKQCAERKPSQPAIQRRRQRDHGNPTADPRHGDVQRRLDGRRGDARAQSCHGIQRPGGRAFNLDNRTRGNDRERRSTGMVRFACGNRNELGSVVLTRRTPSGTMPRGLPGPSSPPDSAAARLDIHAAAGSNSGNRDCRPRTSSRL